MGKKISTEELISMVSNAINEMLSTKEKINFFTVSDKVGVSRPFLYNHPETRKLIEKYRIIVDDEKYNALCSKLKEENKNLLSRISAYDEQILNKLTN